MGENMIPKSLKQIIFGQANYVVVYAMLKLFEYWFLCCFFQTDPSDQDVVIKPFLEQCGSTYMTFWLAIVYGYKGLLMVSTTQ